MTFWIDGLWFKCTEILFLLTQVLDKIMFWKCQAIFKWHVLYRHNLPLKMHETCRYRPDSYICIERAIMCSSKTKWSLFIESQNCRRIWVGRDLLKTAKSKPPAMGIDTFNYIRLFTAVQPDHGWGIHHLSGQPIPVPHSPHHKNFLPYIQSKCAILNLKPLFLVLLQQALP